MCFGGAEVLGAMHRVSVRVVLQEPWPSTQRAVLDLTSCVVAQGILPWETRGIMLNLKEREREHFVPVLPKTLEEVIQLTEECKQPRSCTWALLSISEYQHAKGLILEILSLKILLGYRYSPKMDQAPQRSIGAPLERETTPYGQSLFRTAMSLSSRPSKGDNSLR